MGEKVSFRPMQHQVEGFNFDLNNTYPGTLLWHEMGCISGKAVIKINRAGCSRKYTLEDAYQKFQNYWRKDISTKTRSFLEEGIGLNEVVDILQSGVKKTYTLWTKNKSLRLTSDHEVLTQRGYIPCQKLKKGDKVMVDNLQRHQTKKSRKKPNKPRYNLRYVGEYYPYGHYTTVRDKKVKRAEVHVLAFYADQYGYTLQQFIDLTHYPEFHVIDIYDPKKWHIHHKDHDSKNNDPSNLERLSAKEHQKHHGKYGHFGHGEPEYEEVVNVEYWGEEMTYDLVMNDPHRNFVVNGIVVHNCGKTVTALMILRQFVYDLRCKGVSAPKILLLLPKSILNQWKAECHKFTPEIFQCIIFLPYSKLDKAKSLIMYHDFRAIVMDESHYLKSPETQRMSDLCELLEEVAKSAGGFEHGKYLQLSGTPMLNHAGELYTAWALLTSKNPADAAVKLKDPKRYNDWKKSFTKSKTKSWETRYGGKRYGESSEGVDNENLLTQLIGPVVHYKRASDCLDLPIKQDIHIDLGLDDDKLLQDADIEKPEAYMAILERIAKAKTPHAIDWVKDFFSGSQEQLVIFSPYIFPLKQLLAKNKRRAVIVTGEQNDQERHSAITAFQKGDARIFLTSYKAGGEGINLQCAHHTLYLGYPWSPKIVDQARARTHRKGQMTRTLHHFLMSGENDSNILRLIDRKDEAITAVENHLLTMNQQVTEPTIRPVDKWL